MFPWSAIIGFAGQAFSGIMSSINNKKQQQASDAEAARQQAEYLARANEDPLLRSENQRILNQYDREGKRQIENARNAAAITGATPEYSLAIQKGIAEGRAGLMSDMSAGANARKDRYTQMAENAKHQKALDDQARLSQRQQTYANLAANAALAVGGIMDGYSAKRTAASSGSANLNNVNNQENLTKVVDGSRPMSERYGAAANLAGKNTPEGQVLSDTSQAAQNAQKLASGTAPRSESLGAPFESKKNPWEI